MSLPGFWVDDDSKFLKHNIPNFEKKGLQIVPFYSCEEALRQFADNPWRYAYGIIDLDLPGMDGVEFIRRIREIDPQFPLVLTSAHRVEPVWEAKLEALGEFPAFDKPLPMTTSPDFVNMVESLKTLAETRGRKVFEYPVEEFYRIQEQQREELARVAHSLSEIFLDRYFREHQEIKWVAIAREPGNVIASGRAEEELRREQIKDLAYAQGVPVFVHRRPSSKSEEYAEINESEVLASKGLNVEAEIDWLYSEIRNLLARASQEPTQQEEINHRIEQLRALQRQEATLMKRRFEAQRRLKPGAGWEILERVRKFLGDD